MEITKNEMFRITTINQELQMKLGNLQEKI